MNVDKLAPNAMTYIIDSNYGVKIYGKFNEFGLETNLFLLNSGIYIVGLATTLLSIIPVLILYKLCHPWIKGKMKKSVRNYKFNYFTRMWIQSFLDINILASFGMMHNKLENYVQIIDFAFSLLFLSVNIATFFLLIYLVIRKYKNINIDNDFAITWATFFENCKDINGPNLYYILFIVRRIALSLVIIIIPSGVLQLVVSAVVSLPIPIYIALVDVIDTKSLKWYIIFNDILIVLFYTFILIDSFHNLEKLSISTEKNCVRIVIAAILSNSLFSAWQVFQMIKGCIKHIRNRIQLRRILGEPHETMADASKSTSGTNTMNSIKIIEKEFRKERNSKRVNAFAAKHKKNKIANLEEIKHEELSSNHTENIVII
ncbi:hypothetical protein SteCoe_34497 [Stentor coeruleus]|uniref:TRP C-terminal domain-containing protein n=1 Tax=Stentor coeruleus TaxID=5963 RepID=A0A1R2AUR0_9CILI|nr:hypothetical protein SteCoe_34497 [Stentor coeruleus]